MPVDFIGLISTQDGSESTPASTAVVDPAYNARIARAHEDSGFDQVLIGYSSAYPDGAQVAAHAAAHTSTLKFMVAHRPGFTAPTLAARTFATLDQFTGGRVTLNIITGGHDVEQRRQGDYLAKDDRYARTDEYLTVLRQSWTAAAPFSHEGRFYRFEDYVSQVRPVHGTIPIYFSGSSPAAYATGAKHADVYHLGVTTFLIRGYDPLDDAIDYGRELIPSVRAEIARRDAVLPVAA